MKNQLKQLFTNYWSYLALNAACELQLFDKIEAGQNDINKLVNCNNWDYEALSKLLIFCISDEYLTTSGTNKLSLTVKGELLKESNPKGLYYACLHWADETLNSWQDLSFTIRTGKSSFEKLYSETFFQYLNRRPFRLDYYHKAMLEYAKDDYQKLPLIIDFSKHKSVMDVGGGYGAAISLISEKYAQTTCYLFDLESVIENCSYNNIKLIKGNFFDSIPNLAEAIIIARVLHDWNDEKATFILENCYNALPPDGSLYIIENCSDKNSVDLTLLSLNMLSLCESFERLSGEYIQLAANTGFLFKREFKLNDLQSILIFDRT
jgi:C-methyltransferase